ncbi:hypothetical protein D3C86_2191150 [compost metagenome]
MAAYITLGLMFGSFILVIGCLMLGRMAADRSPHRFVIPETEEERVLFGSRQQ